MTVTTVPTRHFEGGGGITNKAAGGDVRDLATILNQVIAAANTNESDITTLEGTVTGLGTPLDLKGSISSNSDFPTAAAVETGWTYIIAADVTDDDATKTNSGATFKAGDEIVWNGTDWTRLGRRVTELTHSDEQTTAANLTSFAFMAMRAGKIKDVAAVAGTGAAADEDMAVDVQINSVSCLTAAITLDNAAGTTLQSGTIDAAANTIARGDLITIVRTYTAGGAPTPMANTHVGIAWEENLTV